MHEYAISKAVAYLIYELPIYSSIGLISQMLVFTIETFAFDWNCCHWGNHILELYNVNVLSAFVRHLKFAE